MPTLQLVTQKETILTYQNQLSSQLQKLLTQKSRYTVGYRGGSKNLDVYYNDHVWYTASLLDDRAFPCYGNAFGLELVKNQSNSIIVEVNIPQKGICRQLGGLFAISGLTNEVFLMHRGKVGGGKEGIGKEAFREWLGEKWVRVEEGRGVQTEAILITSLYDQSLLEKLTAFIQKVAAFKAEITQKSKTNW